MELTITLAEIAGEENNGQHKSFVRAFTRIRIELTSMCLG
jgi:hypothetical protein